MRKSVTSKGVQIRDYNQSEAFCEPLEDGTQSAFDMTGEKTRMSKVAGERGDLIHLLFGQDQDLSNHPSFVNLERAVKKDRSKPIILVSQSDNFIQGNQASNSKKKSERGRLRYEEDSDVKMTARQPQGRTDRSREHDYKEVQKKIPSINLGSNRVVEQLNSGRLESARNSTERTRRSVNAEEIIRNIKRDVQQKLSKQSMSPEQDSAEYIEWQNLSQSQEIFYDSKDQYPLSNKLIDPSNKVLCPVDLRNIQDSAAGSGIYRETFGRNTMASSVASDSRNFDSRVVKLQLTTERNCGQDSLSSGQKKRTSAKCTREGLETNTERLLAFKIPEESYCFEKNQSSLKQTKQKATK